VVDLLDTNGNMQVILLDSVIFGDSKIEPVLAWNQLVYLFVPNTWDDHQLSCKGSQEEKYSTHLVF
jgi:hypothetical protein